jgi:hypothetical protein
LPPPPAVYNMLVQPKARVELVAPPLRPFMEVRLVEDEENESRWV